MSTIRRSLLTSLLATPCLIATLAAPAQAQTGVPDYFFSEWTVASNCTEQHAGLAASVPSGLKFQISRNSLAADGSYTFVAEDVGQQHWAANWNGLKLQYRPGTQMAQVPADFECIPGQESASPFLAMSGFTQATEPYYEQEHWYGLATIQGQVEHVLIFPRNMHGQSSSIIVLQSASSPDTVKLDDNGVIHDDN
jgi:hypothetical protein